MKLIVLICILFTMLLSGCSNYDTAETIELNSDTWHPSIEAIDLRQALDLEDYHNYDVFDYQNDIVLVLISDSTKKNSNDINDQVNTTFYESFLLFDLSLQTTVTEFPVQKFGICTSALLYFDGVMLSLFTVDLDMQMDSSIYFIDNLGIRQIYSGDFSPFAMGPILQHHNGDVLFSYYNYTEDIFGLMMIGDNFHTQTILSFSITEEDYVSDDFKSSNMYYGYTIGQAGVLTFYVGAALESATPITLAMGTKIHGFDITDNSLIVSIAGETSSLESSAAVMMFDLSTGSQMPLEQIENPQPLYSITVNESNYMCAFSYSTLKIFQLTDRVEEISLDTSAITGDFHKIFSSGDNFLIATYGYNKSTDIWLIS